MNLVAIDPPCFSGEINSTASGKEMVFFLCSGHGITYTPTQERIGAIRPMYSNQGKTCHE